MNVACTNCPAKYGIPDEKVKGRKVRITCKRCGSPIIVDGTKIGGAPTAGELRAKRQKTMLGGLEAPSWSAPSPDSGHEELSQPPPSLAPAPEAWTVAITEENQREMSTPDVVEAFAKGLIDVETFIWREGMEDWLTAFEIPEIADALRARGIKPAGSVAVAPQAPVAKAPPAAAPAPSRGAVPSTTKAKESARPSTAWREPGRWDGTPADLSFDDVTVAMAAPKAQELLDAIAQGAEEDRASSQPKAAQSSDVFEDDERTVVADSVRLGLSAETPALAQAEAPPMFPAEAPPMFPPSATPLPTGGGTPLPLPKATATPLPKATTTPLPKATASPLPKARPARVTAAGGDLFSGAAKAGSEEDQIRVRERMPSGTSEAKDGSLTGARNESSVLFSLDALAKKQQPKTPAKAPSPKEDAAALLLAPSPGFSASDDKAPDSIARLNVGGSFGGMSAPDVTAPAPPSVPPPASPSDRILASITPADKVAKKPPGAGIWVVLGILLVLVSVAVGVYVTGAYKRFSPPPPETTPVAETVPPPAAAPTPAPTPITPTEPAATTAVATVEGAPSASGAEAHSAPGAPAPPGGRPAPAAGPKGPPGAPAAPAPAKTAEPAPAAASGPPFDKDAARAALSAAASQAQGSCPSGEGPKTGKVAVTFANSGRATQALVTGDLAGTTAGGCVAKIFRSVKVPAFSGDPVGVSKSVSVQ